MFSFFPAPFLKHPLTQCLTNLTPKIERQIDCHLSLRQTRLYQAIKSKISLEELLQTAEAPSTSDKQVRRVVMRISFFFNLPPF
jgi:hypothetical protein